MDFILKNREDGLLLRIHNTFTAGNAIKRLTFFCACFDTASHNFVAVDSRGTISIFNFSSLKYHQLMSGIPKITSIQCAPDNRFAIIGTNSGDVACISFETHPSDIQVEALENLSSKIIRIESNDTHFLAHSHTEATLFEWSTLNRIKKLEFTGTAMDIMSIKFVPNNEMIVGVFSNNVMHLWTGVDFMKIRKIDVQKEIDSFLMENEAIQIDLLSASVDKQPMKHPIMDVEITRDGQFAFIITWDGYLVRLSIDNLEVNSVWSFNSSSVESIKILGTSNAIIAALLNNHCIFVFNLNTMTSVGVSNVGRGLITANNGSHLAIKTKCSEILLYDTDKLNNNLNNKTESYNFLTKDRLQRLLKEYHEFPEKHRPQIWKHLLELPHNLDAFQTLVSVASDSNFSHLKGTLRSVCQCIGNWCPIFRDWAYTPMLVKPFLKLYGKDNPIEVVETILTLLLNHGQLWLEFWPCSATNYLGMIENILKHFEPQLVVYYNSKELNVADLSMPIIGSVLSNVTDEYKWAQIFDHIFMNEPWFLVFVFVAFHSLQKPVVMKLQNADAVTTMFSEIRPINVQRLIQRSYELEAKCPDDLHPRKYMKKFEALDKDFYRQFENYPHKLVAIRELAIDRLRGEYRRIEDKMLDLERADAARIKEVEHCLNRDEHLKRILAAKKCIFNELKSASDIVDGKRLLLAMRDEQTKKLETYAEPFNKKCERDAIDEINEANVIAAEDLKSMSKQLGRHISKLIKSNRVKY